MTLKIDTITIAEAGAEDARGALTLVGFNQKYLVQPKLPAPRRLVLAVALIDQDPEPEAVPDQTMYYMNIEVRDTEGLPVVSSLQNVPLGRRRWKEWPTTIQVLVAAQLVPSKYGKYDIKVDLLDEGRQLIDQASTAVYVVEPDAIALEALGGGSGEL